MTTVVFTLDMYDTYEEPLEIDLAEFTDYVISNDLNFNEELHKRIWNFMVHTCDMGRHKNFEPMVFGVYLDVYEMSCDVPISMFTEGRDGGWANMCVDLARLCSVCHDDQWGRGTLDLLRFIYYQAWSNIRFTRKDLRDFLVGSSEG